MKKLVLLVALIIFSATGLASNYPPDYPLSSDCQEQGSVKVCRIIGWNWIGMKVTYKGNLLNTADASVAKQFGRR